MGLSQSSGPQICPGVSRRQQKNDPLVSVIWLKYITSLEKTENYNIWKINQSRISKSKTNQSRQRDMGKKAYILSGLTYT